MSSSPYPSASVRNRKTRTIATPSHFDFTTHVGEDYKGQPLCSFRVARASMTTSSEVWAIDLGAAHFDGENQFWYKADSPEAFEIILNVIHGKPSANPKIVTQAVLHQVAKSAARHQVVADLQDFIDSRQKILMKGSPHTANRYTWSSNFEKRIETSVMFQQTDSFEKAMTEVIRTTDLGIESQVVVHPASRPRIMARTTPNQSPGKSVIRVNIPGHHHSIFSNEVELQAATRKVVLDVEVKNLLKGLESRSINPCIVSRSKTSDKCRKAVIGSIRCGIMVYDYNAFTKVHLGEVCSAPEVNRDHAFTRHTSAMCQRPEMGWSHSPNLLPQFV